MTVERLEIARPDDWHLHLRDGAMLEAIVGFSAAVFGRAIVMPNLVPPVRTPARPRPILRASGRPSRRDIPSSP